MRYSVNEYRVVIVMPEGYPHSFCFRELAVLLTSSFKDNNIICDFAFNDFAINRINIVLGYHLLDRKEVECEIIAKKILYIPFQLEQLTSEEFGFSGKIKFILENGISVWDYSKANIEFLKNNNIKAEYLPIGYHKDLERIKSVPDEQKDIDILFYGSLGDRRKKLLNVLTKKHEVKIVFGLYGKKRDELIRRAKIVLNIHHYSSQLLEMVRISYLINNKIFVISEESLDNSYDDFEIEFSHYSEIIKKCEFYLGNVKIRDAIRKKNYVKFKKKFPMDIVLKKLLLEGE